MTAFEYEFPLLVALPACRLAPGDRVWGVAQPNIRKGFLLDTEPYTVGELETREGVLLVHARDAGGHPYLDPQTLVLVERPAVRNEPTDAGVTGVS